MNRGSLLKAALLGGILSALMTAVPIVGEFLCCAWATAGGAFAAWVLSSDSGRTAGGGRMAMAGFLSGVLGGGLAVPLMHFATRLRVGTAGLEAQAEEARRQLGPAFEDLPPAMIDDLVRGFSGLDFNVWTVVMMLMLAFFFALFGLLGGLVGGALFGATSPAEPTPSPGPPGGGLTVPPPAPPATPPGLPTVEPPRAEGELAVEELPELPPAAPAEDEPDDEPRGPLG